MMKCLPLLLVLYALLPSSGEAEECNRVRVGFIGRSLGAYPSFEATVKYPPQKEGSRFFTKDSSKEDVAKAQFIFLGQKYPHTHMNSKPVLTIVKVGARENLVGVTFERILHMLQSMGTWKFMSYSGIDEGFQCTYQADLSWPERGPLDFLRHVATRDEIKSRRTTGVAIIRIIFLLYVDEKFEEHFLDFQHAFVADENELSEKNTKPKAFGSAADYMFWEGIGQYEHEKEDAPGYQFNDWSGVVDMPYSRPEKEGDGDVGCFLTPRGGISVQVTDEAICNWENWEAVAQVSSTSGRTAEYDETNRQVFHVLRYLSVTPTPETPVVYEFDQTQTRRAGKRGRTDGYVNRKKKLRMDHNKKKRQNNDR